MAKCVEGVARNSRMKDAENEGRSREEEHFWRYIDALVTTGRRDSKS